VLCLGPDQAEEEAARVAATGAANVAAMKTEVCASWTLDPSQALDEYGRGHNFFSK